MMKRLLSLLVCVVMVCSCLIVPASAAIDPFTAFQIGMAVLEFAQACKTEPDLMMKAISKEINSGSGGLWTGGLALLNSENTRVETSATNISYIAYDWNQRYAYESIDFPCTTVTLRGSNGAQYTAIRLLPYGPAGSDADKNGKQWFLCDGSGKILCSTTQDSSVAGYWISISKLKSPYHMLSIDGLYAIAKGEGGVLRQSGGMFFVQNSAGTQVLVASDGLAYAAWSNDDQTAVNQNRPTSSGTVADSAGNVTNINGDMDYSTNIDMNGGTISFPDGVVEELNSVIYDQSTKTYYVDSRDMSTTYNQQFSLYTYHINYTSVTYIGQTEEYNKYYEAYYELPDGRDSADLTKEDLEQLNVSIDVMPYGRSSDNTSLRSLYHFDGDTRDSSYWNYCTAFTWNEGASLTYMDASTFNGALYLDETAHDFTLTLPSRLASADFTLQFRYYQSYTAAPQTDSWIHLGDYTVMQFSGGSFLDGSGTVLAETPIGTWNELALIRDSGTMYYYLNGVSIGSAADLSIFTDEITFHFGADQQTYKYFDELRVLNYALRTGGANYECSAVPHDTNLSLVLPDSQLPVADEYWSFTNDQENLIDAAYADMTSWTADTLSAMSFSGSDRVFNPKASAFPTFIAGSAYTTIVNDGACTYFVAKTSTTLAEAIVYNKSGTYLGHSYNTGGRFVPIVGVFSDVNVHDSYNLAAGTYTLSLVNVKGEIASVTFSVAQSSSGTESLASAFGYEFGYYYEKFWVDDGDGNTTNVAVTYIGIVPTSSTPDGLVYMELVASDETHLTAEWVESVTIFDKDDLNTPTLAVRTDLDITSHQIGGVRPSVPEKGQVWALVERNVITSLQIYTGTAWETVDGRIWTGSRWIPASSYNVITLQDMYDIADATQDYEYIYTESGFWDWFQRAWKDLLTRLDQIIEGLGGSAGSASDCQHVYDSEIQREPTCTEPGHKVYTCSTCGHTYTELIDALGHDWVVTNSVPDVLDEAGNLVEEGYDELTCSRCDLTAKDFGDGPQETDLFDALGDLIADGITWVLDKLTELVEALTGITDSFNSFVERVGALAGVFPMFFGAFFALIPEELTTVLWFGVIAFIVLAVWRKWSK